MNIELAQQALTGTMNRLTVGGMASSAEDLLIDMATHDLQQRVGFIVPERPVDFMPRSQIEERSRCSDAAADMLAHLLRSNATRLLHQWIDLCAYSGQRVPIEHIGSLLNMAVLNEELLQNIVTITGWRGWWLAQQRRDWLHLYLAIQPRTYMDRELSIMTRLPSLRMLRKNDPDAARRWLEAWLFKEHEHMQVQILRVLQTGLSIADEPYLESLLDDHQKILVAEEAANLLMRLDGSAYVQRMKDRMEGALLCRESGTLHAVKYEFLTEGMRRDVVDRYFFHSRDREKDNWYWAMLGAVPPSFWTELFHTDEHTLINMAMHPESDTHLLLKGWIDAAVHHADRKWLLALLHRLLEDRRDRPVDYYRIRGIVQSLPPSLVEDQLIRSMIEANDAAWHILDVITHCHHHWSKGFSVVVVDYLKRSIVEGCTYNQQKINRMLEDIKDFGCYMYPGCFELAFEHLHTLPEATGFLDILGLRRDMWLAFGLLKEGH
ncbi:MAG: DUF5691 domain-containing protein [Chloroflexota bacterium]